MSLVMCLSLMQPAAFAEAAQTESVIAQEQQEEQQKIEASADVYAEREQTGAESIPSLQSNAENGIALQSVYDVASVGSTAYTSL